MTASSPAAILIVEDERIIAHDLHQTLTMLGYQPRPIVSSADEAIASAAERSPDLVLMDVRIKGKRDGIETAQILQKDFGVPVVYLTAYTDDTTLERAKRTEPYGYLVKPVRPNELRSMIELALYRHQMDQRSRERHGASPASLSASNDAIIAVDLAGGVTYMNPVAERLTRKSLSEVSGHSIREIVSALDTTSELDDGRTRGSVMVLRHVTDNEMAQKQIELSDRLASMQTLASKVAHEVNNPLAAIFANAEFVAAQLRQLQVALRAAVASRDQLEQLEDAAQAQGELQLAAQRIHGVMADLKAFSHPVQPTTGQADVRRALGWALHATAQDLGGRTRLTTSLAELPPVQGDEAQLGQVLAHLIANAAQAIAPGDPAHNEISVTARADAGMVLIDVRDSGAGMPPEVMHRAFEPFFAASSSRRGLGLAVCHGLVRSIGGEISVESEVGRGTTFRVRLPAAERPVPLTEAQPSQDRQLHGRILVVDDNDLVRLSVLRMLRGLDTTVADDGARALEILQHSEPFDLILTDVVMPNMGGIELYEALLASAPDLARRVVFMSGGTLTARADDFFRSVTNRRIEKPFTSAQLHELVRDALAAGQTPPQATTATGTG